jgi:CHASE1-domain containing sensor protein
LAEILLAVAALVIGILAAGLTRQRSLLKQSREILKQEAERAAAAEKEKIERERKEDDSRSGSQWFDRWLGK